MLFEVFRSRRTEACAATAAAALFLAGCASAPGTTGSASVSAAPGQSRDPLLDAPYHSETSCTTERPVTVLSRMSETPLVCSDLGVTATLDEMRDAGWRVISLDIAHFIKIGRAHV